jgi:MFS family permease
VNAGPGRIVTRQFVVVSAYGMLALALSLMLVTNLPLHLRAAGWQPARLGSVLGFYFLASLAVRPFVGREADRRGRKAVMLIGALLLLLPCPGYLLSTSTAAVLALRVVQGIGWAMATTATAAMASVIVPQDRIGTGMGIFGIVNGLGFTFGPALGSWLLNKGGGPALFTAAAVLASAVLACALLIREPARSGATAIRWADAGALVRSIARPLIVTIAVSFGYGGAQTFLPVYAREAGVANPGIFFTVFSILSFASRPGMGRLSDVWGRRPTACLLIVVIASTFLVLAYSAARGFLVAAGVLYGIGHGAIYTVLMALLADVVRPQDRGLAYGVFGTAIDLGISAGNFALGSLVPLVGYRGGFIIAAALVLAALPLVPGRMRAAVAVPAPAEAG